MSEVPFQVRSRLLSAQTLVDAETLQAGIDRTAVAISARLSDCNPLVLCVMHGGLPFTAALLRRLHFDLTLDYVHATRYGDATTGGELTWIHRPLSSLRGRTVLLVDDILDRGVTLGAIRDELLKHGTKALYTAVLVEKQVTREVDVRADFVAFRLPDRFLVGFGMDVAGYGRNLNCIVALVESEAEGEG